MTDRNTVLKFAHLSRGRITDPRTLEIIEEEQRARKAYVDKIQAEQERRNAELAARMAAVGGRRLMVAPRYAKVAVDVGIVRASPGAGLTPAEPHPGRPPPGPPWCG